LLLLRYLKSCRFLAVNERIEAFLFTKSRNIEKSPTQKGPLCI
jgi:hypothetical protein